MILHNVLIQTTMTLLFSWRSTLCYNFVKVSEITDYLIITYLVLDYIQY